MFGDDAVYNNIAACRGRENHVRPRLNHIGDDQYSLFAGSVGQPLMRMTSVRRRGFRRPSHQKVSDIDNMRFTRRIVDRSFALTAASIY